MSAADNWQSDIYGILPHPTEPRFLLLKHGEGWALPHVRVAEEVWNAGRVQSIMRPMLNIDFSVLRRVGACIKEEQHHIDAVYLLENHDPAAQPPLDGQWIGWDELGDLPLARPEHRAAIETCLAELEGGTPAERRAPWAHAGWFAEAASWIQAQLAHLGCTLTGSIEQVKSWCLSCVLRAPTWTGDIYFKVAADLPLFVNEATVMQGLAEKYPRQVPAPLRIDRERGWLLLPDWGRELGWDAPVEKREEALRVLGRLQVDSTQRVDDLLAIGCLDRRLNRLSEQVDPLLDSLDASSGLPEVESAQLHALAPRLKAMCAELASYRVPPALVHGDMHMSNVVVRGGDYQFFDWTDACVAHPFLDLIDILHEKDEALQARLRDSYLALWVDFEPMERLLEMWSLAYPLCALHQAVSYQYIIANIEDAAKQEFAWAMPLWLRKILASV